VLLSGLCLVPFETWQWPGVREIAIMFLGSLCLAMGYVLLIISLRTGDLAAVSPFRYSAILWAVLSGYLLWDQLPKATPALGIAIVVAAGLYALHTERLARQSGERDGDRFV
jgi:drug/metabolite transporter (DMT)-like permease